MNEKALKAVDLKSEMIAEKAILEMYLADNLKGETIKDVFGTDLNYREAEKLRMYLANKLKGGIKNA